MKRTKFKGVYLQNNERVSNRVLIIKSEYYCSILHKKCVCGILIKNGDVDDSFEMAISRLKRGLKSGEIVRVM